MEQTIGMQTENAHNGVEEQKEKSKKYNSIDLVKFIMAIFVIAIHTKPWNDFANTGVFYDIIIKVVNLAVPFFFLSSAFLLFKKMQKVGNGDIRSEESLKVLKNYSLRMLKLYLLWQLIYLPTGIYSIVQSVSQGANVWNVIFTYIKDCVFVTTSWWSMHLWFIWSSCIASFVVYLMLKLKMKDWLVIVLSLAIYFLGRGARMFVGMKEEFNGFLLSVANIVEWVFGQDYLVRGFLYFPIALLFVIKPVKVRLYILLPIFVVLFSVEIALPCLTNSNLINKIVEEIFPALANYTLFLLVLRINLKDRKIYFYLRKSSMVIYFIHNYFIFLFKACNILDFGIVLFLIVTVLSLSVATVMVFFAEKKNVKWLKTILS